MPFRAAPAHEVFSFEELNETKDREAFFRDGEWLHLKWNEVSDRRTGGVYTDLDGNQWTVADSENMVDNVIDPFDWDVNYPSVWPSHQGKT